MSVKDMEYFNLLFNETDDADFVEKDQTMAHNNQAKAMGGHTSYQKSLSSIKLADNEPLATKRFKQIRQRWKSKAARIKQKWRKKNSMHESFEDHMINNKDLDILFQTKEREIHNRASMREVSKLMNPTLVGNEYHDNNNNSIEKDEKLKRFSLSDFKRNSIQSSYTFYQTGSEGQPTALRNITKGYIYTDRYNHTVARVVCENKNNQVFITEFYIDPMYMGHGLSHELLAVARNNFNANGAIVHKDDSFSMGFFKKNGFVIIGKQKEYYTLIMENNKTKELLNNLDSEEPLPLEEAMRHVPQELRQDPISSKTNPLAGSNLLKTYKAKEFENQKSISRKNRFQNGETIKNNAANININPDITNDDDELTASNELAPEPESGYIDR